MEKVAKILNVGVGLLLLSLAYSLMTQGTESVINGLMTGTYGLMKIITYYAVEFLGKEGAIIFFTVLGLIVILNQFFHLKSTFLKKKK